MDICVVRSFIDQCIVLHDENQLDAQMACMAKIWYYSETLYTALYLTVVLALSASFSLLILHALLRFFFLFSVAPLI